MSYTWIEGSWRTLNLEFIEAVSVDAIGCPWAFNIHKHLNYNRLFWSIYNDGLKTPLLVRPWNPPFIGEHIIGCSTSGKRLDSSPSPVYDTPPKYELVLGNMRYCACYTQSYTHVPVLLLPEHEFNLKVNDLWDKYHPIFEGNWYDDPNHQTPSKYNLGFG